MDGHASGFLTGSPAAPIPPRRRLRGALTLSLGTHAAALVVLVLLANGRTAPLMEAGAEPVATRLTWMAAAAPEPDGGIGGGGEEDAPAPPRAARVRGDGRAAVPVAPPPSVEAAEQPRDETPMPVAPGLQPSASGFDTLAGVLQPIEVNAPASRGHGGDAGAGGGPGDGIGPGDGDRIGSGGRGLTGDGPGGRGGAIAPRVLVKIPPEYTHEAMRAKVQGTAVLEAVVLPDGTVGDVRIVRSLDAVFGLDQQAIRAVKAWRFAPGTRGGQAIPMMVTVELTFTLR